MRSVADELPRAFGFAEPVFWRSELEADPESELSEDQCVIEGEYYFIRGRVQIPIAATDYHFEWGVWVSVSEERFDQIHASWEQPGRESEPPYFGWLANEVPVYTSTLELRAHVYTRPVGEQPVIDLEPTDHPLAVEQSHGITMERMHEIAELLLHD